MISAEELYRKIKAKYPDLRPPKAEPNGFTVRAKPPLDGDQLKLLEAGFPVKPSYDPRFYKDSKMDPKEVDRVIEAINNPNTQTDQ